MQVGLFRRQAIEQQQDRLHGDVVVLPSLSHVFIAVLMCLWLVALACWLVTSNYARQVSVRGFLQPPDGIVKLFTPVEGGRVTSLLVDEGQQVEKGQPLMIISAGPDLLTGKSLSTSLLSEYQQQQDLLANQRLRLIAMHNAQIKDVNQQIAALDKDKSRLENQIVTLKSRQALLAKRVTTYEAMQNQGHIAAIELDKMLEQQLALQSEYQSFIREQIDQDNRRQQLSSRLDILPDQHLNQINQLQAQMSELALKITQLKSQAEYVVNATRPGTVANLQHQVGQQLSVGSLLLTIVPSHHEVELKLYVPVRSAGFIKPGQQIEERYDAFPFQKFGIYQATIAHISGSILLPNEISQSPVVLNEPSYLVTAKLASNQVSAYGKQVLLKSGMTAGADIRLSERSLLEWLLEPLYSLQGRL